MSYEWSKGDSLIGPQDRQRGQDAADRTAREREQRFQDQMFREAIRTASQPVFTGRGRIFGRPTRRRGLGASLTMGALVLLFVCFAAGNDTRLMPIKTVPAQHRTPSPEAIARAEPAPADPANTPVAVVPDRSTARPPMPPIDRFVLRRFELVHGDNLELVASWQPPDGVRRAAVMSAFIVTRDAARRRTPILAGWAVFPGESTIPLALPPGTVPGKYELETVWTLGGEAREARTHFTLVERPVASSAGSASAPPPVPDHAAVASVATSPPPAMEPPPTPTKALAAAPDVAPPVAPGPPPPRPRALANEQLYTGG